MSDRESPRHHVPSWVIVAAARYGMGRATHITGKTYRLVRDHYDDMHPTDQQVLLRDLAEQTRIDREIWAERTRNGRAGLRLDEEITELHDLYEWCVKHQKGHNHE